MKLLVIFLFSIFIGNQALANSDWEKQCAMMLTNITKDNNSKDESKKDKGTTRDLRVRALTQENKLSDLFAGGGEFVKKHPTLVMSAPQRLLAIINKAGVQEIPNPETGFGKVKVYNLFSKGLPEVEHSRIVGHLHVIETVMGNLEAAARGDTAGKYPALIWGPPGTGKTEFLKIPETALQKAALESPDFYQFTFAWRNLDQVPSLEKLFSDLRGSAKGLEIKSPLNESPFSLLPSDIQNGLLHAVAAEVSPKINNNFPAPKRQPNPQDRFILDEIIKHVSLEKGDALTSLDIVKALDNFVVVKRHLPGSDGHRFVVPAQSKDVDVPGLFMSKSPFATVLGSDHPFAYNLTGLFARSNGGILFIDEVGKNPQQLIAKFLNLIQDQVIQEGGAPAVPLDTFIITATNSVDIQKIREADPQSPFLSRSKLIMMPWHTHPQMVAKTLAYELPNLKATKLGEENAVEKPAREILDELLPQARFGQPVLTPDGRYTLTLGTGNNKVTFSPHALMYISYVASLTRLKFDFTKEDIQNQKWPNVPVFTDLMRDPLLRMKAFMGETDVQNSIAIEYFKMSKALGEGTFGFDHRDVTKWLGSAVAEAQKQDHGNTVTPLLLKRTLEKLLSQTPQKGDASVGVSAEDKVKTLNYAEFVAAQIIIPKMRKDIQSALSQSHDSAANEIYDAVVQSIIALNADSQTKEYLDAKTNSNTLINKQQLEEIRNIFRRQQGGRDLSFQEISSWHNHLILSQRNGKVETDKAVEEGGGRVFDSAHPGLMDAINAYQAQKVAQAYTATIQKFANIASGKITGTPEEMQRASELISKLKGIGYNEVSLREALQLIAEDPSEAEKQ
ncbi:MAG: sigma 54-interacting transcriptional regulator [Oligoflexia bacterium]|nr:sigma 54-interacting transcriptional regulator [Oligoflexia bacterium]